MTGNNWYLDTEVVNPYKTKAAQEAYVDAELAGPNNAVSVNIRKEHSVKVYYCNIVIVDLATHSRHL